MRFRQNPVCVMPLNFKSSDESYISTDIRNILRKYIRGFPRGIWGTVAFPDIYKPSPDNDVGYSFWSKYDSIIFTEIPRLRDSFSKFREKLYLDSCMDDNFKMWKCCKQSNHPSCSILPLKAKAIQTMLRDPQVDISLIFAYLWCTKAWANLLYLNAVEQKIILDDIETGCPNPCFGNPCRNIKGVKNHVCNIIGTFEDDYECHCNEDMVWDKNLRICYPINPCDKISFRACVPENTLQCIAYNSSIYECVCKSEYMGIDCSLPRDACYERVNKTQTNGNYNCQVHLGNICQPILGTDYYKCICSGSYQHLLNISEPNCFGKINPCHTIHVTDLLKNSGFNNENQMIQSVSNENKMINPSSVMYWGITCLNGGQCVVSDDYVHATCVCPTAQDGSLLYTGSNCEHIVGVWSSWTQPSLCFPKDCGVSRYRWRRRKCLDNAAHKNIVSHSVNQFNMSNDLITIKKMPLRCPGVSEEILPCPPLEPCLKNLPNYKPGNIFNYEILYYFICLTIFTVTLSCFIWHMFNPSVVRYLKAKVSLFV
ncbi:hypothetical protein MN116_007255 [Schistosoma mekongi]|uniref:EGF-like domain-containing protein n=1 Tax=Schistosoma mekongi TaxID=38744 RepID=A0AAE1ZA85_SCHME|nr:hypothetical protein MN116_007255 [Schistosoma mekongi]